MCGAIKSLAFLRFLPPAGSVHEANLCHPEYCDCTSNQPNALLTQSVTRGSGAASDDDGGVVLLLLERRLLWEVVVGNGGSNL